MARTSGKYDRDVAYLIMDQVLNARPEGETLKNACARLGTNINTVRKWQKEFSTLTADQAAAMLAAGYEKAMTQGKVAFDLHRVSGVSKRAKAQPQRPVLLLYSAEEHAKKLARRANAGVWLLKEEARLVFSTGNKKGFTIPARGRGLAARSGEVVYDGPYDGCAQLTTEFNRMTHEGLAYCREHGLAAEPAVLQALAEKPASAAPAPVLER